jgi:hypothetical protein
MISKDEYVRKMHSKLDQLSNEIDRMVDKRERIEGRWCTISNC